MTAAEATELLAEAERAVQDCSLLMAEMVKVRDEAVRGRKMFEQHPEFRGRQPLRNIEEIAADCLAAM